MVSAWWHILYIWIFRNYSCRHIQMNDLNWQIIKRSSKQWIDFMHVFSSFCLSPFWNCFGDSWNAVIFIGMSIVLGQLVSVFLHQLASDHPTHNPAYAVMTMHPLTFAKPLIFNFALFFGILMYWFSVVFSGLFPIWLSVEWQMSWLCSFLFFVCVCANFFGKNPCFISIEGLFSEWWTGSAECKERIAGNNGKSEAGKTF